jgi:hypothetical protein
MDNDDCVENMTEQDAIVVQIRIKKSDTTLTYYNGGSASHGGTNGSSKPGLTWKFVGDAPMVARVSPSISVFGLRKMLASRFSRAFKVGKMDDHHCNGVLMSPPGGSGSEGSAESASQLTPGMNQLRQVAFTWEKSTGNGKYSSNDDGPLGSVSMDHLANHGHQPEFAKSGDEEEKELVANIVDNEGMIAVNWPAHLNEDLEEDTLFTKEEYLTPEQRKEKEEAEAGGKKKGVSVMDCIAKYCEMEQLDETEMWYCNRCKDHVRAWKQFHLYRTPPILILHLKRFHFSSTTHRRDKIDTLIDFPLEDLDLRGIVSQQQHGSDKDEGNEESPASHEPIYDCYAVSNHFGGLGGGHYTAYAKGDDGKWCNFDDSRVTTNIDESDVVSSAAYCLYYKRKDVDLGASSLFDRNGVLRTIDVENQDDSIEEDSGRCDLDQQGTMMPISPSPCIDERNDVNNGSDSDKMEVDDATKGDDTTGSEASYRTPDNALTNDTDSGDGGMAMDYYVDAPQPAWQ